MAKILLVEDDKSLREIYGVRLLAEGYDIVSAGDGEEALAMAIKERPDLILSDVMMPKISGFDMLDILRSTSETKGIKVIMMTALSSEDQRLRGEQLGADRYLVKSQVGIEDVVRTVHDVLGDMPAPGTPQDPFGSAVPRTSPSAVPQQPQPQPQAQPQQPVAMAQPMPAAPQAAPMPVPEQAPQPTPTPPQPQVAAPQPMPVAQPAQEPSATPQQPQPQPMPQQPVAAPQLVPATPQAAPMPVPEQAPQPQAAAPQTSGLPQPTAPFSTPRPAGLASRIIQPIERPTSLGEPITNLIDRELNEQPEQQASPADNPPVPPAPPVPPMPSATQAPIAPVAPQQEQVPDTHPTSTIPPVGFEETPR